MIVRLQTKWFFYANIAIVYAMVFQMSFVFDDFWFNRTYTMIAFIFLFSLITRFLLDEWHAFIKGFADLLICFVMGVAWSGKWTYYSEQMELPFLQKLLYTIADSWQFYVLGFVIYVFARLLLYAVHTRKHMVIFFVLGLVVILIVDSFSPIVLWIHIVALVVLFLLWHMLWHYEQVRLSNHEEFEVLLYSPLSIFTPFSVVVGIAIVISLIMPYGPPLLEDPYAIWKKSRGEEVPAFLGDKGFKATIPNVRGRESGYSRDSSYLGGGFDFNYETVMEVVTPKKSYWRGETINYYNGKGWEDTIRDFTTTEVIPNVPFYEKQTQASTEEIDVMFRIIKSEGFPVLFHPSEPKAIYDVMYTYYDSGMVDTANERHQYFTDNNGKAMVTYAIDEALPGIMSFSKDNTIGYYGLNRRVTYPSAYTVTSDVIVLDENQLIQVEARLEDPVMQALYTTLPEDLPQAVIDLANVITSEATSDYQRAKLLEEYLRLNYAYSNQPNFERLSSGEDDFVYTFLFELYEGYCDYFSTAMAVMAKSLDMPTRWVKGFSPGVNQSEQYLEQIAMSSDALERLKLNLSGGTFSVRNADAHSWVEIYFEGHGWIAFEPTPGFSFPYAYADDSFMSASLDELEPLEQAENVTSGKVGSTIKLTLITIAITVLSLIVIFILWLKRQIIVSWFLKLRYRHTSSNEQLIQKFDLFLRYCDKRGLQRQHAQTVQEALLTWTHGNKHWRAMLAELYALFEQARYSSRSISDEQLIKASILIKDLKRQWRS